LVLAANSVRATTIVIARSANEIVIGADSKVIDVYGNGVNRRACKIRQVGNLLIAFEGLEVDRKTDFNLPEISTSALNFRPSGSMTEKISILTGFLVSELLVELSHLKTHEPDTYFKKIGGRPVVSAVNHCWFGERKAAGLCPQFPRAAIQSPSNRRERYSG